MIKPDASAAIAAFLAKGGNVTKCEAQPTPKTSGRWSPSEARRDARKSAFVADMREERALTEGRALTAKTASVPLAEVAKAEMAEDRPFEEPATTLGVVG